MQCTKNVVFIAIDIKNPLMTSLIYLINGLEFFLSLNTIFFKFQQFKSIYLWMLCLPPKLKVWWALQNNLWRHNRILIVHCYWDDIFSTFSASRVSTLINNLVLDGFISGFIKVIKQGKLFQRWLNAFILLGYLTNTNASILIYTFRTERTGFDMNAEYTQLQLTFLAL